VLGVQDDDNDDYDDDIVCFQVRWDEGKALVAGWLVCEPLAALQSARTTHSTASLVMVMQIRGRGQGRGRFSHTHSYGGCLEPLLSLFLSHAKVLNLGEEEHVFFSRQLLK
jgi:hypothetical protein